MIATSSAPTNGPVQLTLALRTAAVRISRDKNVRPYWQRVDLADLGGELQAKAPHVWVALDAQRASDGSWVAYHDLVLSQSGSSGPTRPQATRGDAR